MGTQDVDDFKFFFHHRNSVDNASVIREAYRICSATPDKINPSHTLESFVPLTQDQYPVFDKYPKFVVDYLFEERERIRSEELEYLKKRQLLHEQKQAAELAMQ